MYPVHITGGSVSLREITREDIASVHAIVGDSRVTDWLSFDNRDLDESAAMVDGILDRAQLEPRTEYYFAVESAGIMVGFVRLGLSGVQAAKLGYAINADYWGQGFATEAVRHTVSFGFKTLKLHRISAAIGPDNRASVAIVKRLNFAYEGRIRDHVYTNSQWRDSLLYSAISTEYAEAEL
jgi:RimJ/RimL family protein N-acetyltransferase